MNKVKKGFAIAGISLGAVILTAVGFLGGVTIAQFAKSNNDPATATNTTGLVQAIGTSLYDADGKLLRLKGANVGGGLVTEGWIVPYSCGPQLADDGITVVTDADGNVQYPELAHDDAIAGFKSNPNLTDAQRKEIRQLYLDNWMTDYDFQICKDLKFNALRLPFSWHEILNDDWTAKEESEAFAYLDWFIEHAWNYGLYTILDLHCTPVTQSGYEHSGNMSHDLLWDKPDAINATCLVWDKISEHYKNSELGKHIATYDLINEPVATYKGRTDESVHKVFDKIYKTIRENGDNHNITMCCCWEFDKLPDPSKYGWENVQYQLHIYNWWSGSLPNWLLYDYYDLSRWGHDYNVPYLMGEFTCFEDDDAWQAILGLYDKRGYSWTMWTYKKTVVGYWNDSWGIINQKLQLTPGTQKVNLKTSTYEELKAAALATKTEGNENCTKSTTYDSIKKYMGA